MKSFEIDLPDLTDNEIEGVLETHRRRQLSLDLKIPATKDGLDFFWSHFKCTRCGECCDGTIKGPNQERFVFLHQPDFNRIKGHLKSKRLRRLCSRRDNGNLVLPLPCPFYNSNPRPTCAIYAVRPDTCINYPLEGKLLEYPPIQFSITVDPYCRGACDLFRNLITKARDRRNQANLGRNTA